jgi:hypothetical protein
MAGPIVNAIRSNFIAIDGNPIRIIIAIITEIATNYIIIIIIDKTIIIINYFLPV